MKAIKIAVLLTLIGLSPLLAEGRQEGTTIETGGSTSVSPLMELLAQEYQKANPGIVVNINPTGSGDGIKNAGSLYQIGMTSRELTPAEQGLGLVEEVIAWDGIAVIVHRQNPLGNLSIDQIRDIFTGAITSWEQVSSGGRRGRIAVLSREEGSGTRGAFEELAGFQGALVKGANEFTSTGAVKAAVAGNPDAIGYISLGSVDNTIKALEVENRAPTAANVKNRSYAIQRPFIILYKTNVPQEAGAFIQWILGPQGQSVAGRSWVPVH